MRIYLWMIVGMAVAAQSVSGQYELWDGKLWVTAEGRARVEYRVNNVGFDSSISTDDDAWLLTRVRAGLGAKPVDWFKIYGELQDSREFDSVRSPNLEEDRLDWRQGWFELGNGNDFPLVLTLGRQELAYGDERLVGAFGWNNIGRVFDAAKVRWQSDKCWVEVFGANVVRTDDNSFNDRTYWGDDFFGVYGHTGVLEKHVWDVYGLFRDKDDAVTLGPPREIYTFGTRFATTPKMAPWDYWVEAAGQFGHIKGPGGSQFGETTAAWNDHRAYAGTIGVGYTCPHDWKPRLALEYNYASGDSNPTDGTNETFDNLYPTNHKFYGFIDLFAWKNTHNPHLSLSVLPHKTVKVQLDGHLFWLAESRDAWYRASQAAVRRDPTGAADSFVGSEVDLTVSYAPHKRVKFLAGYSHFFTGDFVKDTGPHSDADFAYFQMTLSL